MDEDVDRRSLWSVINEAVQKFSALMRLDLRLLEAEMRSKFPSIVSSGACGVVALALFTLGSFALVQFMVLTLIYLGISAMYACLVVGIALFVGGMISLYLAKRALVGWTIMPVETVSQVRSDLAALKQGIHYGSTQR